MYKAATLTSTPSSAFSRFTCSLQSWLLSFANRGHRGLKAAKPVTVSVNVEALIVKPEVARAQMDAEQPVGPIGPVGPGPGPRRGTGLQGPGGPDGPTQPEPTPKKITRFHGTVAIDPLRARTIAREVIKHLSGLVGVKVQLTMEIQAEVPEGIPEERQRIANASFRTLKFQSFRFEEE
jgi:hypothetical protein